jgi:hypothetical protein
MELPPSELKTDPNRSGHPEHYELRYNGKAIGAFPHDDMTLKECGVIEGSKLMMGAPLYLPDEHTELIQLPQ